MVFLVFLHIYSASHFGVYPGSCRRIWKDAELDLYTWIFVSARGGSKAYFFDFFGRLAAEKGDSASNEFF